MKKIKPTYYEIVVTCLVFGGVNPVLPTDGTAMNIQPDGDYLDSQDFHPQPTITNQNL